jgi:DNA-binding MarR family transcriptional regulator
MKPKKNSRVKGRADKQTKGADPQAELRALAQHTERTLNAIHRSMRQRLQAEFARGNLTGPQRLVMSTLVRTQEGLSLKQLSHSVSLAHSTVSGIVDRLVKQGLIERKAHSTDRRITLLIASRPVRDFLTTRMPELALNPVLEALEQATPTQRQAITKALETLAHLLARTTPGQSAANQPIEDIEAL